MTPAEKEAHEIDLIVRLADDAEILLKAGRYDSSLILSVIAIENVGKKLLAKSGRSGANNHKRKQQAAASLLITILFIEGLREEGFKVPSAGGSAEGQSDWSAMVRRLLGEKVFGPAHNGILDAIFEGWLYDARNDAVYGTSHSNFKEEDIKDAAFALLDMCKRVIPYLNTYGE